MKRYDLLDTIRGITIISMIAYHACWDLWYFGLGVSTGFLYSMGAYIWQQSICWTFLLLSGFCYSFGHHPIRRGLLTLGCGIVITLATLFVIPDERDVFGVLWLLGSSTLLMTAAAWCVRGKSGSEKVPVHRHFAVILSVALFFLTRNINRGYLGFEGLNLIKLPERLYHGYVMTFLGFTDPTFYSSDYFSLLPWFFLFTTGFFLHKIVMHSAKGGMSLPDRLFAKGIRPLSFLGRHSLLIYMLHQVVLYGAIYMIYTLVS